MGVLSNYCGFGGSGIPQHQVDEICAEHDRDYAIIQKAGKNPYLHYNWADQKMLKALEKHTAKGFREKILKQAATGLWKLKSSFTNSLDKEQVEPETTKSLRKRTAELSISPRGEAQKRLRGPKMKSRAIPMEVEDEETSETPAVSMAARTEAPSGRRGVQETRVIPQQPQYGLPEIMTVVMPWTTYFSLGLPITCTSGAVDFRFRTTSLADMFTETLTAPAPSSSFAVGLFTPQAPSGTAWQATLRDFPVAASSGAQTGERPAFRTFWLKMYQAYHVMKCEWEVTFQNPRATVNSDVLVAWKDEAYSSTSSGNVVPNNQTLFYAEHWPDLNWNMLHSQADGAEDKNWLSVKGTYYPNQAQENVRNDEDVQTWTKYTDPTAPPAPALTEQIHFMLWKAPFNDLASVQMVNVRLHLRITAQLRDLRESCRYPVTGVNPFSLNLPQDLVQSNT